MCQDLESGFYEGVFPWQQLKQHDAASLLKKFIRDLPHPLLTVKYLNAFIAVDSTWSNGVSFMESTFDDRDCSQVVLSDGREKLGPLKLLFEEVDL